MLSALLWLAVLLVVAVVLRLCAGDDTPRNEIVHESGDDAELPLPGAIRA